MSSQPVIDVSHLPAHRFDSHAPIWWGNLLMLVIESTMFGIVIACYFYVSQNFFHWPPPRTDAPVLPNLLVPTVNLMVLLVSLLPMIWVDQSARRGDKPAVKIGLVVTIALGVASILLRWFEFPSMQYRWDSNVYGSVVWTTLGLHLGHLLTSTLETAVLTAYVFVHDLDEKHRVDLTVTAVYWYWVVGVWVPIYGVLYFGPRLL